MKPILWNLLACAVLFPAAVVADDRAPDLHAPKPESTLGVRVLLYVPGSPQIIDYPAVYKILCAEPTQIVFETPDGFVVTHQGPYTLIQSKNSLPPQSVVTFPGQAPGQVSVTLPAPAPISHHSRSGSQYYDVK